MARFIHRRDISADRLAICHPVTRAEAAQFLGVKVEDIPEVPAQGKRVTRWIVYTVSRDWKDIEGIQLFTQRRDAMQYWYSLGKK